MKFSIKDFFCKYGQIRMKLRIWSHLLKKSLMENLIFCAVHKKWWEMINKQWTKYLKDTCAVILRKLTIFRKAYFKELSWMAAS